jgi:hypothetical protein
MPNRDHAPVAVRFAGAALAGLSLFGCGRAATPADHAAAVETTKCDGAVDEEALAPVLTGGAIERVDPLYTKLPMRDSDGYATLNGARITVRPLPGMTAELLERALECHSARGTLGQVDTSTSDPFVLPSTTVDIQVASEGDAFRVGVEARRKEEAHEILDRATQLMAMPR